jgi:putative selenate reductase molybdopterin-binding subunit
MRVDFRLNGEDVAWDVIPSDTLLDALRANGMFGAKHGCGTGDCGACTVIVDGMPVASCVMLAAQAAGRSVVTIEGLGGEQQRGWRGSEPLHALQEAFIETGAIQCGYCTPAMLLAASVLLASEPNPTEAQVRDALAGVLCRCTGYVKPVQAVLRAAAVMRGEEVPPIGEEGAIPAPPGLFEPPPEEPIEPPAVPGGPAVRIASMPTVIIAPSETAEP